MPPERLGVGSDGRRLLAYAAVVVLGLVVGTLIAPALTQVAAPGPATVAVVPIEGSIDGPSATNVTAQLERAARDPSVGAIVIRVNSPGGTAPASETLYLAVQRITERTDTPVVTSVDATAASGAYYTVVPSDTIYVKPSSVVGSVGVLALLPTRAEPNDVIVATGPAKISEDSQRAFYYEIEAVKRAFLGSVMKHRGDDLAIDRAELAAAGTYTGTRAVQLGVADRVGGLDRAVTAAARRANLSRYAVEVYRGGGTRTFVSRANYLASNAPRKQLRSPTYLTGLGGPGTSRGTYLMIPPSYVVPRASNATAGTGATDGAA